jgi:hypothetical protein
MPRILAIITPVALLCVGWTIATPKEKPPSSTTSTPVLVELFTSEGCSDCPPADALLAKLDSQSPAGVQPIVLSEHVDYWNHIGWTDPFSSRSYSERQTAYGNRFGLSSVYTPQMVVDGSTEFVGSDGNKALASISMAAQQEKIAVRISAIQIKDGDELHARVETGSLPDSSRKAEIFVAAALNHAESSVARGENAGRHLTHVAVVRELVKVGDLQPGASFSREISLKLEHGVDPANLRLIAFVQEPGPGRVLGAGFARAR